MSQEEKKWGEYNTFPNPAIFDTLEEWDIWYQIDRIGGAIFWQLHDSVYPWRQNVSSQELMEAQYNLEFLVYFTRKFGVEFSREPSANEHVERSKTYNAWFEFWNSHFKSMTQEEYNQFVDDKKSGKDISKYLPKGDWRELLKKEETR